MAKFSLIGATVSIAGEVSCVEAGDIDFGDLNLVETTCSTDAVKTYVPGTFNNATGNVTLNDTGALADWLEAYDDGVAEGEVPEPVTVVFTWPDTGAAALTVSAILTNVNAPVGVNQNAKWSFRFSGVAGVTFTA